jgi:segregation and condensation protein A
MNGENYQLKLAVFEGPFDLLLYLIKKNQIDIYDIPIAQITEEYLNYIEMMQNLNLDVASEFIVIAVTLMYIKAKMLLPKDDIVEAQEEDPRTDLVKHLLEYSTYKEISERMKIYEARKREIFERLYPINISKEDKELALDVYALIKAMDSVIARVKERKLYVIASESIKVKDRINELVNKLQNVEYISFFELCKENYDKIYIIALFLAILELLKLRIISVKQDKIFDDIQIFLVNKDFDRNLLNDISI